MRGQAVSGSRNHPGIFCNRCISICIAKVSIAISKCPVLTGPICTVACFRASCRFCSSSYHIMPYCWNNPGIIFDLCFSASIAIILSTLPTMPICSIPIVSTICRHFMDFGNIVPCCWNEPRIFFYFSCSMITKVFSTSLTPPMHGASFFCTGWRNIGTCYYHMTFRGSKPCFFINLLIYIIKILTTSNAFPIGIITSFQTSGFLFRNHYYCVTKSRSLNSFRLCTKGSISKFRSVYCYSI